jgi:hypothetical protein
MDAFDIVLKERGAQYETAGILYQAVHRDEVNLSVACDRRPNGVVVETPNGLRLIPWGADGWARWEV